MWLLEADDLYIGEPDGTDDGEDLMHDLRSAGVNVPATMTFKSFPRADEDILSCVEPTDEEMLRQVVLQLESSSDDDDDRSQQLLATSKHATGQTNHGMEQSSSRVVGARGNDLSATMASPAERAEKTAPYRQAQHNHQTTLQKKAAPSQC